MLLILIIRRKYIGKNQDTTYRYYKRNCNNMYYFRTSWKCTYNSVVFTFHVPVFFFITGYFTNTNLCIKDFIKNKTRTLLVPYVFTSFLIILLSTLEYLVFVDKTASWQALTGWLYAWISPAVLCYLWKIYCYYFRYNNLRKLEPAP